MGLNVLGLAISPTAMAAITILLMPAVTKDIPHLSLSPVLALRFFLSPCKFSTLTTRQPINVVECYLLLFSRCSLYRRRNKNPAFDKNRTHNFRTSNRVGVRGYPPDHSGDGGACSYLCLKRMRSDVIA